MNKSQNLLNADQIKYLFMPTLVSWGYNLTNKDSYIIFADLGEASIARIINIFTDEYYPSGYFPRKGTMSW